MKEIENENENVKRIRSVLAKQALFHVVAFLLWLHVLVFLKWDSDIGVPDDIVLTPWYESQEYQDKFDQLVRLNEEHEKAVVKMQSLQNRFNAVSKTIEKMLREYADHPLGNQKHVTDFEQHLFAQATDASFHVPTKLRQLLEKENLEDAYPLENSLRPAFREATADLQQNMELGTGNIDWKGLQSDLKSFNIPERPLVEVLPNSCEAMANKGGEDEVSPREGDMNERIQNIRDLAAKRWNVVEVHGHDAMHLPFSFRETAKRQQAKREAMLVNLEASRLQIAKEQGVLKSAEEIVENSSRQCIKTQEVLPWLEDSLHAYFRGRDPRQAILRRVIEAYPAINTSEALIELPSQESGPGQRAPKNLRQLLDGPWMMESARGINAIIDSMGGYSDWFDQYVDGLGVDDVGKVVIHALMQRAGSVKLPSVPDFIDEYRKQSTTR